YRPGFPARFQSIEEARSFCQTFFAWYNNEHRHSGIGYVTPAAMHAGVATAIYDQRAIVLQDAFTRHPNRFKHRQPRPPALPTVAGINMPKSAPESGGNTEN
ncbi:integrase core domain-containing protein, partial [Massilia psychrophila]